MSIATELTNLNNNILDAYSAVQNMGGTVPANKNMANLDTAINSIPGANPYAIDRVVKAGSGYNHTLQIPHPSSLTIPAGVECIGPYALAYAYGGYYNSDTQLKADVDLNDVKSIMDGGMEHFTFYYDSIAGISSPTGVNTSATFSAPELVAVGNYGLAWAFADHNFASVSFPELTNVGSKALQWAFAVQRYSGGTTFSFPALTSVTGTNAFDYCWAMATSGNPVTTCGPTSVSFPALTSVTSMYAFQAAFLRCGLLASVDFSALTTISGSSAFIYAFQASGITSVPFSALTTISGSSSLSNCFNSCTSLTTASFPALTTINGYSALGECFRACTNLTTVSFPELTTISGSSAFAGTFRDCTSLTSASFPVLTDMSGSGAFQNAFNGCTALTSVSFPSLTANSFDTRTNQFTSMLTGVTGCTLHFPAATQAKIETMSGYPNFGGTNTTVLFDL